MSKRWSLLVGLLIAEGELVLVPAESGDTRTNVAVVFLTACSDIDTCDAAKESGSLAYLLRP